MIENKVTESNFRLIVWALLHGWTVTQPIEDRWIWRHPGGKELGVEGKAGMYGTPPLDPVLLAQLRFDWRRREGR